MGYDFLCKLEDRHVMVEVKTFTPDGRVIVSARELKAAASMRSITTSSAS